jgi:1-deoxy-D-xylulose-5-phosphate reductoisomerase
VEYEDGAVIAQLGTPDMRLPIQYALYYPKRRTLSGERLDLFALGTLSFERPDPENFRGLALAYEAMRRGGNIPTAYNAANERAVALFLNRKIGYPQIPEIIEAAMEACTYRNHPNLDEILETEQEAYDFIGSRW